MPLYSYDAKQAWDDLWDVGAEGAWGHPSTRSEVRLNYHRFVVLPYDRAKAPKLAGPLGWDAGTRLLVYGCGFGWVMTGLAELGLSAIYGLDHSTYIQGSKSINEDADLQTAISVVNLGTSTGDGLVLFNAFRNGGNPRSDYAARILATDLSTISGRRDVRTLLGGPGADVLTYDGYLNTLTDAEVLKLSENLHGLQPNRVIHHTWTDWTSVGDIELNAKTPEEWKILLPDDTIIEEGSFRVVE
jgi:hypothetical protein